MNIDILFGELPKWTSRCYAYGCAGYSGEYCAHGSGYGEGLCDSYAAGDGGGFSPYKEDNE